jgi:hypothetical protein
MSETDEEGRVKRSLRRRDGEALKRLEARRSDLARFLVTPSTTPVWISLGGMLVLSASFVCALPWWAIVCGLGLVVGGMFWKMLGTYRCARSEGENRRTSARRAVKFGFRWLRLFLP